MAVTTGTKVSLGLVLGAVGALATGWFRLSATLDDKLAPITTAQIEARASLDMIAYRLSRIEGTDYATRAEIRAILRELKAGNPQMVVPLGP